MSRKDRVIEENQAWKPYKHKVKLVTDNGGRVFRRGYRRYCTIFHQYYHEKKIPYSEEDHIITHIREYLEASTKQISADFRELTGLSGLEKRKDILPISTELAIISVPPDKKWIGRLLTYDRCLYELGREMHENHCSLRDYKDFCYGWQKMLLRSVFEIENFINGKMAQIEVESALREN